MTSVYGVTFVGAREQIKRRLEEKGHITDDRLLFSAACYTAKVSNPFNIIYYASMNCDNPLYYNYTMLGFCAHASI